MPDPAPLAEWLITLGPILGLAALLAAIGEALDRRARAADRLTAWSRRWHGWPQGIDRAACDLAVADHLRLRMGPFAELGRMIEAALRTPHGRARLRSLGVRTAADYLRIVR